MLGVIAVLLLLVLLPAPARGANSAAIFGDPDHVLSSGTPYLTRDVEAFQAKGILRDHVRIGVRRPGGPYSWSMSFAAPKDQRLEPRNYMGAQRTPFADDDRPGMELVYMNGCNRSDGEFEVRDIVRRADGSVRRLWIVFKFECEGRDAIFGEIRIGMPDAATLSTVVRWHEHDAWWGPTPVPVRYDGPAPLAATAVVGPNAADFTASDGGCRTSPCDITVAYSGAPGIRTATLRLTDAAGGVHDVALEGFAHGGVTHWVTDRGGQETYDFSPHNATFDGTYVDPGYAGLYGMQTVGGGIAFYGRFLADGAFEAGRTYQASRTGTAAPPTMDVAGVCPGNEDSGGSFTVNEVSYTGRGGLRTFDVTWEQMCGTGELRKSGGHGRWQYRAGDTGPLPDWLIPGPRPGLGPMPPEGTAAPPAGAPPATASPQCGPAGFRRLAGTRRGDLLRGGNAADRLLGRGGADRLLGRGGGDCLYGSAGADRLDGGAGRDALFGGTGNDVLIGGTAADLLDCGAGRRDRAVAGPGDRTRGCERVVRARR